MFKITLYSSHYQIKNCSQEDSWTLKRTMDYFTFSWISSRNDRLSTYSTVLLGMTSSLNWASLQNSISVSVLNLANLGKMSCMTWKERKARIWKSTLKTQAMLSKFFFLVTFVTFISVTRGWWWHQRHQKTWFSLGFTSCVLSNASSSTQWQIETQAAFIHGCNKLT